MINATAFQVQNYGIDWLIIQRCWSLVWFSLRDTVPQHISPLGSSSKSATAIILIAELALKAQLLNAHLFW